MPHAPHMYFIHVHVCVVGDIVYVPLLPSTTVTMVQPFALQRLQNLRDVLKFYGCLERIMRYMYMYSYMSIYVKRVGCKQ